MKNLSYQNYLNGRINFDEILWDEVRESIKKKDTFEVSSPDNNIICNCEALKWDTDVLGISTSRINNIFYDREPASGEISSFLKAVDRILEEKNFRFASVRMDIDSSLFRNAFEHNGWTVIDVLNIYGGETAGQFEDKESIDNAELSIGSLTLEQALDFFDSERDLFLYARIHRDANVPEEKARRFYRELFIHIFNKPTSVKLALFHKDRVIGLAIGEQDEMLMRRVNLRLGYLWEIGLSSEFRGHGYSKFLLNAFLKKMSDKADFVEIGTQTDNTAANKLYTSNELKLVARAITLHKWFR